MASTAVERTLTPIWLGRRRYAPVHALQERLQAWRASGEGADVFLLLEHEPVVTCGRALGRGPANANLRATPDGFARRGIDVVETGRGGDVTYHGPGQLVGYPIVDLKPDRLDVRRYVNDLAAIMAALAADFGLGAGLMTGLIGVWVDKQNPATWPGEAQAIEAAKIGAIGVRLSRWVTMHGFAFNGATDLDEFRTLIVPCGIADRDITSIADLLGSSPSVRDLATRAARHAAQRLGVEAEPIVDLARIDDAMLDDAIRLAVAPRVRATHHGSR